MRARPNPSGDQLVTDYLTQVAQAASRLLPKGARMAFVGRTRALIEREVGPPGTRTDPGRVRQALEGLGKPEDLVIAERTRIDQGWVKSRAASKEEGEAAAAALTGPRMNRPLTARLRPNSDTQPLFGKPAQPEPAETITGPDGTVIGAPPGAPGAGTRLPLLRGAGALRGAGPSRVAGPRGPGGRTPGAPGTGSRGGASGGVAPGSAAPGTAAPRSPGPRRLRSADSSPARATEANPRGRAPRGTGPQAAGPPGAGSAGAGPAGAGPVGAGPAGAGPVGAGPVGAGRPGAGRTSPIDWLGGQVPGKRGAGGTRALTASAARLARNNLLETVAVLLLGLGGLILPFPFWLIGAIVAMFSKLWDVRDKALAFVGPLLVTLVASVLAAVVAGGSGNVIVVYFHGLHVAFGALIRVGSVVTAAYLVWRLVKGPRPKVPPWKRITR